MDAFIDSLVQLLIDWGYAGLFLSALLAGSILPFSSELVLVALVKLPDALRALSRRGQYGRRTDVLLHGPVGQDGMD